MANDGSETLAAPAPAGGRRPRRLRTLLVIVVGFLVALGVVAGGALLFFYDRATAIDRSTPQVSVVQFLDATLLEKDVNRVTLFVCRGWSSEDAMRTVGALDAGVSVSWHDLTESINGGRATVSATIVYRFAVNGGAQRQTQTWTFDLSDEDGWRVCGIEKTRSFEP